MGRRFYRPYVGNDSSFAAAEASLLPDLVIPFSYEARVPDCQPAAKRHKHAHAAEASPRRSPETTPYIQSLAYEPLRSTAKSPAVQQLLCSQGLSPCDEALQAIAGLRHGNLGQAPTGTVAQRCQSRLCMYAQLCQRLCAAEATQRPANVRVNVRFKVARAFRLSVLLMTQWVLMKLGAGRAAVCPLATTAILGGGRD